MCIPVCRILYCRRSSCITSHSRVSIPVCDFALRSILVCSAQWISEYPRVQLCTAQYPSVQFYTAQYSSLQWAVSKRVSQCAAPWQTWSIPSRNNCSLPALHIAAMLPALFVSSSVASILQNNTFWYSPASGAHCCNVVFPRIILLLLQSYIHNIAPFSVLPQQLFSASAAHCFFCKAILKYCKAMLLLFPCNDYSLPALYYAISFFHSAEQYSSYLCPIKFLYVWEPEAYIIWYMDKFVSIFWHIGSTLPWRMLNIYHIKCSTIYCLVLSSDCLW